MVVGTAAADPAQRLGHRLARELLGELHIRLVVRVDTEDHSRSGHAKLPAEELLAQVRIVGDTEAHDRVARGLESRHVRGQHGVGLVAFLDRHEDSVGAVVLRRETGLAHHRHDPATHLPRALRDQLLHPVGERRKTVGGVERELVSPVAAQLAEDRPQAETRVLRDRYRSRACLGHTARPVEERPNVDPGERGGDQSEVRERGVPTSHGRDCEERLAKVSVLGQLLQGRSWVGDGDEVTTRWNT